MTFAEQIELLKATQGDPALLALATVDLQLAGRAPNEREKVRESLKVAAVPHWFDKRILAALLETDVAGAVALLVRLRELNVVEAFPAGGPGAVNVHQTVRTALRKRLAADNLDRLRRVSSLAYQHFVLDEAVPTVIEALYHRFVCDPSSAADKCGAIFNKWNVAGRHEPLLALRTMLEELLNLEPWALPTGLVRGAAHYYLARIRLGYRRVSDDGKMTEELARKAVAEFEAAKVGRRTLRARAVLGKVLEREATSVKELEDALAEYRTVISLVENGEFGPSDDEMQRLVSNLRQGIERVQKRLREEPTVVVPTSKSLASAFQLAAKFELEKNNFMFALSHFKRAAEDALKTKNFKVALESFRESVTIRERMAAEQPWNANHLANLAFAYNCVGDVHRRQGDARAASGAFETGMKSVESLVKRDPLNAEWQKDLAAACARTARELLQLAERDQAEARRLIQQGISIMQALGQGRKLRLIEQDVFENLQNLQRLASQADPTPQARGER